MSRPSSSEELQDSTDSSAAGFPPLTRAAVLACQFSSWYPTFRKHSPKATVIKPLEDRFIDYLESDGLFLPEGSGPMGVSELSDDEDSRNGSESEDDQSWQVTFPELDADIRRILTKYDGAVFPKLNWSSPQDAAWMIPGQALKCQCPADVYLLLKSSDFISHDLDHAFDECVDYEPEKEEESVQEEASAPPQDDLAQLAAQLALQEQETSATDSSDDEEALERPTRRRKSPYKFELVLKKWFDMPKSQEWRCFVKDRKLVAISQRDTNYYDFLQPEDVQADLRAKISAFFKDEIRDVFPSQSYVIDLYLTRGNDRLFIIDFNPYAPQTDALLFAWESLNALSPSAPSSSSSTPSPYPLLRVIDSPTMSSQTMPSFSHNRYPKDVVELSDGTSIADFAKEWAKKLEEGVKDSVGGEEEREGSDVAGR
ncbi:D123-domain-containing protein [Leucosporidium creatinivorum]|uniref:D123-domain-containing protein n=1 Tax=Leucosporidium creatinivorum TaxID=106004 RepID=A0A1Y2FKL2_9BASI|nr:D123-domain-containing protein [Leucosporidium creatinivorum]